MMEKRNIPTISELYSRLEYELKHTDYDGEVRGDLNRSRNENRKVTQTRFRKCV